MKSRVCEKLFTPDLIIDCKGKFGLRFVTSVSSFFSLLNWILSPKSFKMSVFHFPFFQNIVIPPLDTLNKSLLYIKYNPIFKNNKRTLS